MAKDKKALSQKPLISLWQYLLVVLIIILPAGGFYGGMRYQQQQDDSLVVSQPHFKPDTLVVIRAEDTLDNHPLLIKTITDKEKVTEIYNQLYALPYMPNGEYHCPIEFFANYTLDFFQANDQILNASFNPTGCTVVQISNEKARWAATSQGKIFSTNLQKTLDLSNSDFFGR